MGKKLFFFLGLFLVITYWLWVKPPGLQRGYIEDHCTFELARQNMADQIRETGSPRFETHHYMFPVGTSTAYLPQSIEQSWLGAHFWNWNRDFPYFWAYFGASLLLTYFGVGYILIQMGISPVSAWVITTLVTLFHVPRHFKTWYHSEHLYQHWIYLGYFLDAWIWQRVTRQSRWSWSLEFWRGFFLMAVFGTAGYFWGPSLVEWVIVRLSILALLLNRNRTRSHQPIRVEKWTRASLFPIALCLIWLVIELQWFIPLLQEARKVGGVPQGLVYHAPVFMVIRPLWFDWVMYEVEKVIPILKGIWYSFQAPETKVTIGWLYWVPAILGIRALRKRNAGPGLIIISPFLILLGIAIWYLGIKPHWVQHILQALIPFMAFFRVASRWGLFLPQIVTVIIVLSWPELSRWFMKTWKTSSNKFKYAVGIFVALSVLEASWIFKPVVMMPAFSASMLHFLEEVRDLPGSAVLDIPFCVIGGNSICEHQCVGHPQSTAGACFRQWHDKDVYGIYESRLVPSQCVPYSQAPFALWFDAWRKDRCFTPDEWKGFCSHLDEHPQLAAVLLYSDLWPAILKPSCQQELKEHLGEPLAESQFYGDGYTGGVGKRLIRVQRYPGKCQMPKAENTPDRR
jgi:hypothetical protein